MKKSRFTISTEVPIGSVVITNCAVGVIGSDNEFEGYPVRALWDTGASSSAISERLLKKLERMNLEFYKNRDTVMAHGDAFALPSYKNVTFMPSEGLMFTPAGTDVAAMKEQKIDAIIGMDIIFLGCFKLEPIGDYGMRMTYIYGEEPLSE